MTRFNALCECLLTEMPHIEFVADNTLQVIDLEMEKHKTWDSLIYNLKEHLKQFKNREGAKKNFIGELLQYPNVGLFFKRYGKTLQELEDAI